MTNICPTGNCCSPPDLHALSGLNFASAVGAGACVPRSPLLPPPWSDKDVAVLVKRSQRLIREECRLERTNGVAKGGFKEIKVAPAFIRHVNNVRFKDLPRCRTKRQSVRVKSDADGTSREKGELRQIKRIQGSRHRLMSALMRRPVLCATSEDESLVCAIVSGGERSAMRSFRGSELPRRERATPPSHRRAKCFRRRGESGSY